MEKCSVPDCHKPSRENSMCKMHATRVRRHGSPEVKKVGGVTDYVLSSVLPYRGEYCLLWPFARNNNGYGQIRQNGKIKYVHRLACEHVNGLAGPGMEAAHTCGNGHLGCVAPAHLVWKTHTQNMSDTLTHGTRVKGERVGTSKLSAAQVAEMRASPMSVKQLSVAYGVSDSQVRRILKGERWAS